MDTAQADEKPRALAPAFSGEILSVTVDARHLGILLDISESMNRALPTVRAALREKVPHSPRGHNNKRVAVYSLKAGETYTLILSGRSQLFKAGEILFRHQDVAKKVAEAKKKLKFPVQSTASQLSCRMTFNWADKIVLVTGGGGGMGQAAAKRFADAGAKTFVCGRTLESLEETAKLSENIVPLVCDVSDAASISSALDIVLESGTPDTLIHTAGINTADRFMAHEDPSRISSEETWKKMLDINVLGVVNMIQSISPLMAKNGGGKIVVVSSTAGHGFDSFAGVPYTAGKWAVHGLLFTARQQLSKHGVVLSEYAPGEANTPLVDHRPILPTDEHRSAMLQCEDCGDSLFFIASQEHSVSLIQLPNYQPFGGMPPEIPAPWLKELGL